jgi:hypothetical protein
MIVEYSGSVLGACSVYWNIRAVAVVLQDCVSPMYDESCKQFLRVDYI